ncbi:hypothetical protein [Clostridium butyricum]
MKEQQTVGNNKEVYYIMWPLSNQSICYAYFSQFDKFEELKNINKSMTLWLYENIDRLDIFGSL